MPVVVMKSPSPLPCSTTLVSPATSLTPASEAALAMDSQMRARSARGKPSSRMNPAVRYRGLAPMTATSLTVPWTDRQPMSPPGKNRGETTWLSVETTRRPAPAGRQVPSLPWARYSLPRYLAKRSVMS